MSVPLKLTAHTDCGLLPLNVLQPIRGAGDIPACQLGGHHCWAVRNPVHLRHSDATRRGTVWKTGRLPLGAGEPKRSAVGAEQEQVIRSRLPALIRQQQTKQISAAALRPGRPSGRATVVGS